MGNVNYGLPYMGSKSKIADWVVSHLPSSNVFVDLFAGGCAITHCAMKHNRWSKYIANDITDAPRLFLDAANGKYRNETRWISREDFFRLKDTDPYVRICWSFGNDQSSYLYAPEVERFKRHLHNMFFAGNPHDARLSWKGFVREFAKVKDEIGDLTKPYSELSESLQSLQSLQSLERLQRLERINVLSTSYENVSIDADSVVYCDIPYIGTCAYLSDFNHNKFYDWARNIGMPVYISEYQMPDDFVCIDSIKKRSLMSGKGSGELKDEKIFVHESQVGGITRSKKRVYTQLTLF